ncbi:helix-turn-helix domain-containing protein [Shimia thalassica]|uniref:helix-turn-helix domain-containing protein n=1 Tax=Shimia thalassica TaxID=1715693 RepID=UPI0026E21E2E|nr:helix-turn-helix domain-containing protein [Shimia thalassica]MDO6481920.1 helix-turn-helix domain-containing protein [Shimia thalassica]
MTNTPELINQAAQILAVSPNEAARLCSIGRTTLYAALSSGELRSVKIGTRRLITLDALRDWLKLKETPAGE